VDSQGAAAAVVHESVVALIELFARQLTGSSAPIPQHGHGMPHGWFSGAVFNVWLYSSCCGDLAQLLFGGARAELSSAHPATHFVLALGQRSDLLTTGPPGTSSGTLPCSSFGYESVEQHVWCSSKWRAVVLA
jgi:hypothetical protein